MSSTRSRVHTETLGGSPLSRAVQERRLPEALQVRCPAGVDEWREHVAAVRDSAGTDWLARLRPAMEPSGASAERLARIEHGRGVVVTTGQQAALFGGPLYTLNKAITALAVADAIESHTGVPAAPVFWAATDDADFDEAASTWVADANGLHALTLAQRPPAGTPMAAVLLDGTEALLRRLREACGSAAHGAYLDAAVAAFQPELTLGRAYVRLLRAILEPLGIAVLDSSHESYREAALPTLREALRRAPAIAVVTADVAAAIRSAGYEPQVQDDRGLSLVFSMEEGTKRRLTVDEAAAHAAAAGPTLAPNVLLRPVVERAILPTAAYIGGPGELAYFTQSNAVARALDAAPVVGLPRWSATIVEPFAARALERLGVDYRELGDLHALQRRLAGAAMPAPVADAWERLRREVSESVAALAAAVAESALVSRDVIVGLERSLTHRLDRGERRLLAAAKRRDARTQQDLAVASAAIFPRGKRQERVLNFVPLLARGGPELLRAMRSAADAHASAMLATSADAPAVAR